MDKHAFIHRLRAICGENIIADEPQLKVYETDGLTAKRRAPWLVVLPSSVKEVQQVVKLCFDAEVPLVARGAGTGLSGGALPHADGVLLILAKLKRILSVDTENRLATVEPGVTNLAISEAVKDRGLYYAPDPSSQVACSIGGNVAENSGGVHCLKYGLTVHNVRRLKIISPTGDLYEVGSHAFDSAGYDLLALLHGSEGMFGIVVEITVALLPIPESVSVVTAGFAAVEDAASAVTDIISAGIIPAGLEMMDKLAIEAAEAYVKAGYPTGAEALLLCELDGIEMELETQLRSLMDILKENGATSIDSATVPEERERLWRGRKAAFPAIGRIAPDYYCMDGTIPRRHLSLVLNRIAALSEEFSLPVANVFHAGDGNLHPLILYDANEADELRRAEEFGARILECCIEAGGTITGEHGVGIEKIDQMCIQFSETELSLFHGVKAAFDEKSILNPGKAVPSLHRCVEFGAQHVHQGKTKFPELDLF
ncbi:MAG: FAD-binding oxidoreductase [Gammaproteobacteria bacterium]|nr:FAD-binding oxidoreductase [Gammaproteobacteria bacterium]